MLDKGVKIALLGGDDRMFACAKSLAEAGYEIAVFGFDNKICSDNCTKCCSVDDALVKAGVVVLPLPVTMDGKTLYMKYSDEKIYLTEVLKLIDKNSVVLGGNLNMQFVALADEYDIKIIDYFDREELKIANAYLTAESAIGIALNELKHSISESPALVMGYGRIGKILCRQLKGMDVQVYASARKNRDFAWIRAYGYSPVDTSKVDEILSSCKIVFNTIPESVLGFDKLCLLPEDCLVIDLASKPGGVDFEAAKVCGIKVIWALGLPGKMKEKSAGRIISDTIINILEDEVKSR